MDSYLLMVAVSNKVNFIIGYHLIKCFWSVHASNSHLICGAQDNLISAPNSFIH